MKKLVLPALLFGLVQATGCGPIDGDIDVAWNLVEGADDELRSDCLAIDGDTVEVQAVDRLNNDLIIENFFCEDESGLVPALLAGDYDVSLGVFDAGGFLVAESFEQTVSVFNGDITLADFDIATDGGYLGFGWSLEEVDDIDGTTLRELSCDQVNADGVRFTVFEAGTANEEAIFIFPCDDLQVFGEGKLFFGTYDIVIELVQGDTPLSAPLDRLDVVFDFPNEVVDLNQAVFEFLDSDIPG